MIESIRKYLVHGGKGLIIIKFGYFQTVNDAMFGYEGNDSRVI